MRVVCELERCAELRRVIGAVDLECRKHALDHRERVTPGERSERHRDREHARRILQRRIHHHRLERVERRRAHRDDGVDGREHAPLEDARRAPGIAEEGRPLNADHRDVFEAAPHALAHELVLGLRRANVAREPRRRIGLRGGRGFSGAPPRRLRRERGLFQLARDAGEILERLRPLDRRRHDLDVGRRWRGHLKVRRQRRAIERVEHRLFEARPQLGRLGRRSRDQVRHALVGAGQRRVHFAQVLERKADGGIGRGRLEERRGVRHGENGVARGVDERPSLVVRVEDRPEDPLDRARPRAQIDGAAPRAALDEVRGATEPVVSALEIEHPGGGPRLGAGGARGRTALLLRVDHRRLT